MSTRAQELLDLRHEVVATGHLGMLGLDRPHQLLDVEPVGEPGFHLLHVAVDLAVELAQVALDPCELDQPPQHRRRRGRRVAGDVVRDLRPQPHSGDPGLTQRDEQGGLNPVAPW